MAKKGASYSAKTDKHTEHKHLFGSGGNSDFIINMTAEGTRKLSGVYSMIAMIVIALSSVPYYISKAVGIVDTYMMLRTENNDTLIFLISTLLIAAGFVGALIFLITCVKKEIVIGKNKALMVFVGIIISALISALSSADINSGLYGYLDRADGLISLIGYIGFFTIGMCLTDEKWRKRAAGTIIAIGTVNGVAAILQSIPALAKWIPSYYNYLFLGYKSNIGFAQFFNAYGAYDASYAGEGFTCSPFALGALLTIACAFALGKACYTDNAVTRIVCLVCTGVMIGAAVVSQVLPAMLGVGCVIVVSLITAIADCAKSKSNAAVISPILALVTAAAVFAGVLFTDNFLMSDEQVIFTDSFERLGIAYDSHSEHSDGIYSTLWYEGWLTFSNSPVIGVGPDNWGTMYSHGEGMETDRTYNELIDTAIQRGLLGLAFYLLLLIVSLMKAVRMLKAALAGGADKTVAVGAFTAFVCFAVQSFFNTTSICSTPFFYLTIGLIWSYEAAGRLEKKKK